MDPILKSKLEDVLNDQIVSNSSISGGCINSNHKISTKSGQEYFLKTNLHCEPDFFKKEASGLEEIAKTKTIRVPEVVAISTEDIPFLLLEYLVPGTSDPIKLAEDLAAMHSVSSEKFGLPYDNYIGASVQVNAEADSWGEFFYRQRLLFQLELGLQKGWLSQSELEQLKTRENEILEQLSFSAFPSLLHGDLWSGNIYWSSEGPALVDPAVYYGCFEADLAMTEMFGRLPEAFYQRYFEVAEFESDYQAYQTRRELYNLYHLINHANLFGGGYVSEVRHMIA